MELVPLNASQNKHAEDKNKKRILILDDETWYVSSFTTFWPPVNITRSWNRCARLGEAVWRGGTWSESNTY